jgi:hypothetical protein
MPRLALTRALFAAAANATTRQSSTATANAAANPALALYRSALRAIARLPNAGAREYYRAYARQNLNEYRDERDPQRLAQLLEHGRSAADFLIKKHLGGGGGGGGSTAAGRSR